MKHNPLVLHKRIVFHNGRTGKDKLFFLMTLSKHPRKPNHESATGPVQEIPQTLKMKITIPFTPPPPIHSSEDGMSAKYQRVTLSRAAVVTE